MTSPTAIKTTNLVLRGLQFICCLLGMSLAAAGGIYFHSSTFVLVMNYTGMLYTLWYVVLVEATSFAKRLSFVVEQVVDGVLALLLLIGGICLASSDYLNYCSVTTYHCDNLKASAAFTFIGMFFFLGSLALSFMVPSPNLATPSEVPHVVELTPNGALSPVQGFKADNNV